MKEEKSHADYTDFAGFTLRCSRSQNVLILSQGDKYADFLMNDFRLCERLILRIIQIVFLNSNLITFKIGNERIMIFISQSKLQVVRTENHEVV